MKQQQVTLRSPAAENLTYVVSVGEVATVNYPIKKIFEDAEHQEDLVIRNFRITAADGKRG